MQMYEDNENMEAEEVRNLNELLKINDYSLMTNDEIEHVIEYRANIKAEKIANEAAREEMRQAMAAERERARIAAEEANAAFQNALQLQVALAVVEDV